MAWDEADQVYLIDLDGETIASRRTGENRLRDDRRHRNAHRRVGTGGRRAALAFGLRAWPIAERAIGREPTALAIDPHGRFVALSAKPNTTKLFTRFGKPAGEFETLQPIAHLQFVATERLLVAGAAYGSIFGVELEPSVRGT